MFEEILRCAQVLVHAAAAYRACGCECCITLDAPDQCELLWIRTVAARELAAAHL